MLLDRALNSNKNLPRKGNLKKRMNGWPTKCALDQGMQQCAKISANKLLGLALHVWREKAAMFLKSVLQ